nr:reverse transcriptase domain-containing protein [Tanacetum cinerariifolium]
GCSGRNSKIQEVSQHSESRTPDARGGLRRKLRTRYSCSMSRSPEPNPSVFSRIRRDRSKSPRHMPRGKGKRDGGVFNRLRSKGKSVSPYLESRYQTYRSRRTEPVPKKRYHEGTSLRSAKAFSESEDNEGALEVKNESRHVKGVPKCMRISGFMHGITNPELIKHLHNNIPKSVDEIMRVTIAFLRGEVAASNQARKKALLAWKQQEVRKNKILTEEEISKIKILFPPLGDEDGTEGPMIIGAEIGGYFIHRIYVDGRSVSQILYEHCFNRLRPEVKNQMLSVTAPLIGFSGEIIWPMGQILLPVKIGDAKHSTSAWMNFVVVRSPSLYSGIIWRPKIKKIQAIPSTTHGMLKFPVLEGILTLRSSKIIPLQCTIVFGPEA